MALGALAIVVHINRTFHQPQGRYLFPALPAIGLLWGLGMSHLIGQRPRTMALSWTIAGLLACLNVIAVVGYVVPAYYPPVVQTVSRRAQPLPRPSFAYGLKPAEDGWLEVTNGDPQIAFNTAIIAEEFRFLKFEIEGAGSSLLVPGSVFFATDEVSGEDHKMTIQWRSDGQRRMIIVPLLKNPLWRGRITTVRIDPFDPPQSGDMGRRVRISAVQLQCSPPS